MKGKDPGERFVYLPHTADCMFQAYGKTIEEAFCNAVLAMTNYLTPVDKIPAKMFKKVSVSAARRETLLYDFLEQILYFIDAEGFLSSTVQKLKITLAGGKYHLIATIGGDSYKDYELHGDIKAITYSDMLIKEEKGKWIVQVVLDI
ncbi:MAG: archease [Nanoarchaeota archaeon]